MRLLLIGLFVVGLFWLLTFFAHVTVPVMIALLLSALLQPLVGLLQRARLNRAAASGIALIVMVLLLGGVLTLVGTQTIAEWPTLVDQSINGLKQLVNWLSTGPLHISTEQLQEYLAQVQTWLQSQASVLAGMAAGLGASVGSFLAGMLTVLLATFFFLMGGREMWDGISAWLLPQRDATRITAAARRGWDSLVASMRAMLIVSFTLALLISLSAWALGVPMPVALFALTFVAAFIPIVGAFMAGMVAVVLALVNHGVMTALIMLAAVILVNLLEANVLSPLLTSKATHMHPLGIMLGLTAGATLGGILGALFAIPVLAFTTAFVKAPRYGPEGPPESPEIADAEASPDARVASVASEVGQPPEPKTQPEADSGP